ncbi:hypothetical protein D3C84_1248990 [compost metagenome]
MYADDHHATILCLHLLQVFQAFDIKPFAHARVRPEPGHAGLQQCHAYGFEILGDQFVTLLGSILRKT